MQGYHIELPLITPVIHVINAGIPRVYPCRGCMQASGRTLCDGHVSVHNTDPVRVGKTQINQRKAGLRVGGIAKY